MELLPVGGLDKGRCGE